MRVLDMTYDISVGGQKGPKLRRYDAAEPERGCGAVGAVDACRRCDAAMLRGGHDAATPLALRRFLDAHSVALRLDT